MLWLALVFPDLALECLPGLVDSPESWLLSSQGRVVACNASARQHGIVPGQGLAAAFALDPQAQQRPRDIQAEAHALRALAEWALGFASEVSLEAQDALLLEVGSTLRYFGGLPSLRTRLQSSLAQRAHRHQDAYAPTPLAALWLARALPGTVVEHSDVLPGRLAALPLEATGLPAATCAALRGSGVDCVAQVLALPSAALARRFGPQLPALFDRALGRSPDPRLGFLPEQRFSRQCELAYPLQEVARLMPLLERMIPDLVDWGWRTGQVLTRIALSLGHEGRPATRLEIGFAGTRNPEHLRLILGEHLDRLILPTAVVALTIEILEAEAAQFAAGDLLPAPPARLRKGQELLERLRARLGKEAVHGLALRQDHRPERAWRFVEPGARMEAMQHAISPAAQPQTTGSTQPPVQHLPGPRPLWLLERPRDLGSEAVPHLGGPLCLLAGPERIEGGWWDGADVARDYFVAAGPDGPQYWVYRDRRGEARWFLQGVFA